MVMKWSVVTQQVEGEYQKHLVQDWYPNGLFRGSNLVAGCRIKIYLIARTANPLQLYIIKILSPILLYFSPFFIVLSPQLHPHSTIILSSSKLDKIPKILPLSLNPWHHFIILFLYKYFISFPLSPSPPPK